MNHPSIFKSLTNSTLRFVVIVTYFLLGSLSGFAGVFPHAGDKDSLLSGHQAFPSFFEMNMGQWAEEIRFTSRNPGMNLLFCERSVVYQLYKTDTTGGNETAAQNKTHVLNIGLHFRNPGPECTLRGIKPTGGYVNRLFGNDSSQWISNIPSYQEVQYSAIYPGIDMKFFARKNHVKYDIILHPGSDIQQLIIEYSGIRKLDIDGDGQLLIFTDRGTLKENIPETYQIVDGKKVILALKYALHDSLSVGFILPEHYDKTEDIIIDPSLIYSTYIGGSGDDQLVFGGILKDNADNIYGIGQTTSTSGFPVTPGAWDVTYNSNTDMVVYKLNSTGSALLYATYIGGGGIDIPAGIALCGATNEVVAIGSTESSNFPVTTGAYQVVFGGGGTYDIVLFKLNATGSNLLFSTYLGGAHNDQGFCVVTDSLNNIYGTGQTTGLFPVSPGAWQPAAAGGWDAVFFKLSSNGTSLLVSSYFGGSMYDRGGGIDIDAAHNIYLHGMTTGNLPVTSGAFQTIYGGGTNDSFVAKFNAAGSSLLYASYLGGSNDDYERAQMLVDPAGNAYVTGRCGAGFPVTAGAYDISFNGGYYDAYVTKINPTGSSLIFSTYLGGLGDDTGYRLFVNPNSEVFVVGECTVGFPTTSCSYDPTFNGGVYDGFISRLSSDGTQLLYSSYIGGSGADRTNGVIVDINNNIYIAGNTASSDFPCTAGSFDQSYNGGANDLFVLKLPLAPFAYQLSADTSICSGSSLTIGIVGGTTYSWSTSETTSAITVNPLTTTTYFVTISDGTCFVFDSVTVSVISYITVSADDTLICQGNTATITASGAVSYFWNTGATTNSITVTPAVTTSYSVTGTASGCTASTLATVTVNPQPQVHLGNDTVFCFSGPVTLDAGAGFSSYLWQDGSGAQTLQVSSSGIYSVSVTDTAGCNGSDALSITLLYPPEFDLGPGDILCDNTPIILNAGPGDGTWSYLWQDLSTSPSFTVTEAGTYYLTITNDCGQASDSILFAPCPGCIADLPDAFSPNGDGINDIFRILGEGLSEVTFLIYNRHGQKVFETSNPTEGWDGRFNGVLQENEVYFYYLSARCLNGETISRKGDLTLVL